MTRKQRVLGVAGDLTVEVPHERPLVVLPGPDHQRVVEPVELRAPVALAGPHALEALAQLGVPQQRGEVVEGDDHGHVIDRCSS